MTVKDRFSLDTNILVYAVDVDAGERHERSKELMGDWLEVFPVASADEAALVRAMDAVEEHRLSFWDAMLWATARQSGCAALLSEDMQDGRRLSGVTFINPFAADAAARLAPLLDA